jgi:peptidoglycan biosynthesis protein MviN/MurJ (putative lipid II flippase)
MIVWRVKNDNHQLLARMTYCCCVWVLLGATAETIVTIYLLHRTRSRWGIVWRIVIPMVFSLWIITQLYGAYRLFQMARLRQRKYKRDQV